ncbi:MAG: tRNA (adenosine(37)-N6)-threonylcarbamoyltransferase complex dimerization subunit type 1 TsaB [Chitinophagales bacterium]
MSLVLNIDTSLDIASICLAKDGALLRLAVNENQKDHAAWLQPAIQRIIKDEQLTNTDLNAVAVSIGPGSYTGLRVGLSTAKGLCYALNIPLITVGTLEMMAIAGKDETVELLCPMIDARRMEVFTAVYTKTLQELINPHALVIDKNSFSELLSSHKILFYGNGSEKLKPLLSNDNAIFKIINHNATHMIPVSQSRFIGREFADLVSSEPMYLKEFFSAVRKPLA